MSAVENAGLWMTDFDSLAFEEVEGLWQAPVKFESGRARVIRYDAGTSIPMHRHTKETLKVILRGRIAFAGRDGPLGVVSDLGMYTCAAGWYRAEVLETTFLLLIEELDSERVAYPS